MFFYNRGVTHDFNAIAKEHFNAVVRKKKSKSIKPKYSQSSIITRIESHEKIRGLSSNFFKDLKANNYELAQRIIEGRPNELAKIVSQIKQKIRKGRYPKMLTKKDGKEVLTTFGKRVKSTFDYEHFTKKTTKWNAYSLAEKLNINVCTYCNRSYTFTIQNSREKIVRPEFDHFLPKSIYPYLALSFYNLIPSCHICNSNLKHNKKFSPNSHIHPYENAFDQVMKFSVKLNTTGNLLAPTKASLGVSFFYGDLSAFDITFVPQRGADASLVKKAKRNIKTFKLTELYSKHKDLVVEMILNSIVYSDAYVDGLASAYPNLFRNREDVLRLVTKNYTNNEDLPKRTFSKLAKDVHIEFGLRY